MSFKVSICIPVGPCESFRTLESTLNSILNQDVKCYEIVIKTYELTLLSNINKYLSSYEVDSRVISGNDDGIYDAMNICIKNSVGDYILLLGCGDVLDNDHVIFLLREKALKLKNPSVMYGQVKIRDSSGEISLFSNKCFFGRKKLLPWRNPCHSQGIVYGRNWINDKLFIAGGGPLSDLIHTHHYGLMKNATWIGMPLSIFCEGGVSNDMRYASFVRCRADILLNCNNFKYPFLWKVLSYFIYTAHYLYRCVVNFQ